MLSCSSPRSSPPSLACCAPRNTAPLAVPRSHSRPRPRGGEFAHQAVKDGSLLGWGAHPCASAARAPLSVSLHRAAPVAWRPPHLRRPVVRIPGWVIPNPGPLGAHPPGGLSFLLRPQHPLLPYRGRVRRRGHGFLFGHDPGPRAVEGRLLPALRPAPRQVRVPRPTTHAEVFGVTWGGRACGGAVAPGSWRSCS